MLLQELLAGGVAGGLSKTSVAPLERIKILFQVCTAADMLCSLQTCYVDVALTLWFSTFATCRQGSCKGQVLGQPC